MVEALSGRFMRLVTLAVTVPAVFLAGRQPVVTTTTVAPDPCSGGACDHFCEVVGGIGYRCSCQTGFTLAEDMHTCHDVDECAINNGGCTQNCTNYPGNHSCHCSVGFNLTNGTHCEDVNECAWLNGGCSQNCSNTLGSHQCVCDMGYTLGPDQRTCFDNDECPSAGCEHYCDNLNGTFMCRCYHGYMMLNGSCADIDECSENNGGCDHRCFNTPGSYLCSCEPGYKKVINRCFPWPPWNHTSFYRKAPVDEASVAIHPSSPENPAVTPAVPSAALLDRLRAVAARGRPRRHG